MLKTDLDLSWERIAALQQELENSGATIAELNAQLEGLKKVKSPR